MAQGSEAEGDPHNQQPHLHSMSHYFKKEDHLETYAILSWEPNLFQPNALFLIYKLIHQSFITY